MSLKYDILKPAIGARVYLERSDIGNPEVSQQLLDLLEQHIVLVLPEMNLSDEEQRIEGFGGQDLTYRGSNGVKDAQAFQLRLLFFRQGIIRGLGAREFGLPSLGRKTPRAEHSGLGRSNVDGQPIHMPEECAEHIFLLDVGALVKRDLIDRFGVLSSGDPGRDVHPFAKSIGKGKSRRAMRHEHPLVWIRPNGLKSLVIGSTADMIIGKSQTESRATLARLLEWSAQPPFTYRHEWRDGDCVVWDNTCALHRVVPYAEDSR